MKETILKQKEFVIRPPKTITIGDPYYFEQMEKLKENKSDPKMLKTLKHLTLCDYKPTCCKYAKVRITLTETSTETADDDFTYETVEISIVAGSNESMPDIYLSGKYYGDDTVKENRELGCDTASFIIDINGVSEEIHTGADGYYGNVMLCKQYYGYLINLTLDTDFTSFDEAVELVNNLFDVCE